MEGDWPYHKTLEPLPDWLQGKMYGQDAPVTPAVLRNHNQYCRDDWAMYNGDGPRGMGPNGDGCVCDLAPEGYGDPASGPDGLDWPYLQID